MAHWRNFADYFSWTR